MSAPSPRSHRESHIFPALAVIALLLMLAYLPQRYEIVPRFVQFLIGAALAVPMLAAGFFPANSLLSRAERYSVIVVLPLATCLALVLLAFIVRDMARPHSGVSGLTLLSTSIGIWVTNVLVFALGYWQLDRGGPMGRTGNWHGRADFTFPRGDPSDCVPPDWQPGFADYLALAFNTSTAFSPTDVLPLTARAKMMMVLQSSISLVAVIAVGARAINILGT
jgi:hypothetical protein